jgi:HEAT repeat protein
MKRTPLVVSIAALVLVIPGQADPQTYLGKAPAEWQRQLGAKDAKARRDAAFALGKLGPEADEAIATLLRLLQTDNDKAVRDAAAYSLGQICKRGRTPNEVIDVLCKTLLGNGDGMVRRSCAVALGNCAPDTPQVREALGKALEDRDNPGVRQNAAWALGEVCQRSDDLPVKELRKGLQDGDKLVKRDAALAVARICRLHTTGADSEAGERQRRAKVREQGDKAIRDLLACAKHDYLELRKAALDALANLSLTDYKAEAVPLLAKICEDAAEDPEVRRNAALTLGNIGGDEAKPAAPVLRDNLRTGDIEQKRLVALTLRQLGPNAQPAMTDLCRALTQPDLELRQNAAYGLGGLGAAGHEAVPFLVKVVADSKEDYRVRVAAAMSLQTIGGCDQATSAIPELLAVLDDTNQPVKVRERVLWALRVHKLALRDDERVIASLKKLLTEKGLGNRVDATGGSSGKMLRYDSAFLLSVLKRQEAPDEVLDVLNDFLHDSSIKIYAGITVTTTGGGSEGEKAGRANTEEKTTIDGRIMAIDALGQLGDRVKKNAKIMDQLRAMSAENSPFEIHIQKAARELLKKLGG